MHLVYAIDRLSSGGAQRQVVELAVRLARTDGVRVTLLSYPSDNFYADRLRDSDVAVVQVPKSGRFDAGFPLRLRRWFDLNDVDVVHAFILGPILWGYAAWRSLPSARRPAFVPAERNVLSGAARRGLALKRWIYPRSTAVTANSRAAADEIEARFSMPGDRVAVLPNAIDVAEWDRAAAGAVPFELEPERFHLALLGRFAPQKNHRLVLEALTLLGTEAKDLRVWFIGDDRIHGDLAREVSREIEERNQGDVVRVIPPIQDVAALLSRLDGLLLPSSREGFPNVVLEAMTVGTPVIAAAVGEVPRMLEHEKTGLVLEETTAQSMAQAIRQLRGMTDDERAGLTRRARETVESRYGVDGVAAAHLEFYRGLVSSSG